MVTFKKDVEDLMPLCVMGLGVLLSGRVCMLDIRRILGSTLSSKINKQGKEIKKQYKNEN